MTLTVEVVGLELFGHHGVDEDERRRGQLFVFDVFLEVPNAALSDRIEDAVDYREVVTAVQEIAGRPFRLLEALSAAVARELLESFPAERVRVRVRKPEVVLAVPVEHSAVTCELSR